jgi:glucose-1-phosphate thymidylyltransferase
MKGLLFLGGKGTRMYPSTRAVNKHFQVVDLSALAYYSLSTLLRAGCDEICILSRPEDLAGWYCLIDSSQLGIKIEYQLTSSQGTGYDLNACAKFLSGSGFFVVMGDCVHLGLSKEVFTQMVRLDGASLLTTKVLEPSGGVIELGEGGLVVGMEEEPETSVSDIVDTGVFWLDSSAMDRLQGIYSPENPSLHLTDLLRTYLKVGKLFAVELPTEVFWSNTGTPSSLLDAAIEARQRRTAGGLFLPLVVSYENGWITLDALEAEARKWPASEYCQALAGYVQVKKWN